MNVNENPFDEHDAAHEHEHENEVEEALEEALELDTQSQIFLEMRRQNLDLLKIAAEVAGFSGPHPAIKSGGDLKHAMKTIWDIYSEFYAWIDPEESDDDDEEDEDL